MTSPSAIKAIIVIEDDIDHRLLIGRFLEQAFPGTEVRLFDPLSEPRPGPDFDWSRYDILLLDVVLGTAGNGLDWLREFKRTHENFPATIMCTGAGGEETAVKALKWGAADYLRKQEINAEKLMNAILEAAGAHARLRAARKREAEVAATPFSTSEFYRRVEKARAEAAAGRMRALLLVRVDDARGLRGSLGLLALDALGEYLAHICGANLATPDFTPALTRFGDDAVALLVGDFESREQLESRLQSLCQSIGKTPFEYRGASQSFTVSIGAVTVPDGADDVETLINAAAEASEAAAADGGCSIRFAQTETAEVPAAPAPVEDGPGVDLLTALREGKFQASFDPLMALTAPPPDEPERMHYFLRPRLIEPDGVVLDAGALAAAIEHQGVVREFDRWTIREGVRQCLGQTANTGYTLIVKIGRPSLADAELGTWIDGLLAHYRATRLGRRLAFSVAAGDLAQSIQSSLALLKTVRREYGFRLVLEAPKNVAELRTWVDSVKFSHLLLSTAQAETLAAGGGEATALLAAGREAGLQSIVTGIDCADALQALIVAGVDLVAGEFVAGVQDDFSAAEQVETLEL